jgi:hypothetical protein
MTGSCTLPVLSEFFTKHPVTACCVTFARNIHAAVIKPLKQLKKPHSRSLCGRAECKVFRQSAFSAQTYRRASDPA